MANRGYIWQKTYEALITLTSNPSAEKIRLASHSLAVLKATMSANPLSDEDEPDARESWQALDELMAREPAALSDEQRQQFARHLWVVFNYSVRK